MNFEQEFSTVELILKTDYETRGVDAFILSLIKAEKQVRRIFTFLIYQNPCYNKTNIKQLRTTLANNKKIFFSDLINGLDLLLPEKLGIIYGNNFDSDYKNFSDYTKIRNKIFHGQITESGLTRSDLLDRVSKIKNWCNHLGKVLNHEIGYDGFSHSYIKSTIKMNTSNFNKFDSIDKYKSYLKEVIQRQ